MKALFESILQGWGSLVTVRDGQSARTYRALVQPVTETGWQNAKKVIETLGRIQKGQYVYFGPAGMALSVGQKLETQEQTYIVRRSETMYLADQAVYVWALLVKAGGEAAWSS